MTKVAYNACFGGFGLSDAAFEAILNRKGVAWEKTEASSSIMGARYQMKGVVGDDGYLSQHDYHEDRTDPDLIAVIEELADKANGMFAKLRIEDVPAGTAYRIDEYDGNESVITKGGYEWKIA